MKGLLSLDHGLRRVRRSCNYRVRYRGNQETHWSRGVTCAVMLSVVLSACGSTQSMERTSDGSTVYLDQLSNAAKSEERRDIVQRLREDVGVFHAGVGDEFRVFFDVNPVPTRREYLISVGDQLRIEFVDDPEHSSSVTVRPDGRISLPAIGSVMAAGQTADRLTKRVQKRYSRVLNQTSLNQNVGVVTQPQLTVDVVKSHSSLDRFVAMIGGSPNNMSLTTSVLPDGTLSLPQIPPVHALGYPLEKLEHDIDTAYSGLGLDVTVSLVPRMLRAGSTMVIGEVPRPGRIPLDRPHTVLTAVAQAGGVLPTGSMQSVRIVYVGADDKPRVRVVNLKEVINDLKVEDDMIVPDNSVIYVPPTELTEADRISKAITSMLAIQGWGFGAAYVIDQPSNSVTTPVPAH